jgi:hypothetical protein
MNFKSLLVVALITLTSFTGFAHEGHETVGAKSLHGGVVKKSKNVFVEVVQDENIEIYITDHAYKNAISSHMPVSAYADVKGKKIPLKIESHNSNYIVTTDLKKEKHFKLNVVIKFNGKDEKVVFPLEN